MSAATAPHSRCACRLAPGLLVVLRDDLSPASAGEPRVVLADGDGLTELGAHAFHAASPEGSSPLGLWLFTVAGYGGPLEDLLLALGDQRLALIPGAADALCEPRDLADSIARFGVPARTAALEFLSGAPLAHRVAAGRELSGRMAALRAGLREPLARTEISPEAQCVVRLERVTAIDPRAFWLSGWLHVAEPEEGQLTVMSPEGARIPVAPGSVSFHEREDVVKVFGAATEIPSLGFHVYVELDTDSLHPDGWLIELRTASGAHVEDQSRNAVSHDLTRIRHHVLDPLRTPVPQDAVIEHQVFPVLERLHGHDTVMVEEITEYGQVAADPEISVVIPTARVDLIAHQLLSFTGAEAARTELMFVIPPSIAAAVARQATELTDLYGVGFRVLMLSDPPSMPIAVNLAAAQARGRLLVLMRDDVFASRDGWLQALRDFHDRHPDAAAVGPKLLYEDGAIAHVGGGFAPGIRPGAWEATYPLRGLAAGVAAAREPRPVQALSAGCLMIETELFAEQGGLCRSYLEGGEEVGDLCLGLAAAGRQSWCVADVELTFLDHGGWPTKSSPATRRFNDWLLGFRRGEQLRRHADGESAPPAGDARRRTVVPRRGSGRARASLEILDINLAAPCDWLLDARLDQPGGGAELEAYAGTYSLAVEGWAIGAGPEALTVEISDRHGLRGQAPVRIRRQDVARRFPDAPRADTAGFGTVIGTIGLPAEFELAVEIVREDGERAALATIHGRRRSLRSAFAPALQPLLLTTLGRTGSSWLELLVGQHPEIVACRPFVHDARLTSYWTQVLRTFADPASYLQVLRPELYPGNWWTGEHRPGQLPLRMAETHMASWLGGESVEIAAGFCQTRIEDFYAEQARAEGREHPRYFAEKCWPDDFTPQIIAELYPDGREILLVRDFRDMVCSILGFNAKRGTQSFGREAVDSDDALIAHLRDSALQMLESWRDRRHRAHLLRYENLILEPERTLAQAFAYVGVADDAETIAAVIAAAQAELPDAQRDHRTTESPAESVGRWRRELTDEQRALCDAAFGEALEAFGYEPTVAGARSGESQAEPVA